MENKEMNEQNWQDESMAEPADNGLSGNGMDEDGNAGEFAGKEDICAAGEGKGEWKPGEGGKATDSPNVKKLLDELTDDGTEDAGEGKASGDAAAMEAAMTALPEKELSAGGKNRARSAEDEELELLRTVKSERGRERIRSIISARKEAETRLQESESSVKAFKNLINSTGMDTRDIAATLTYGRLVAQGDPASLQEALGMLERQREELCRRLGIEAPGVDLFADVPEIKSALERNELKKEHALRLAETERAERAVREREREEYEKAYKAVDAVANVAEIMKTMGTCLQPYGGEADHQAKMLKMFEYMASPGWADNFVANVPQSMWAGHIKYLYDNLAVPVARPAVTAQPLRSSPVASGPVASNPNMSHTDRILRRIDEMGL